MIKPSTETNTTMTTNNETSTNNDDVSMEDVGNEDNVKMSDFQMTTIYLTLKVDIHVCNHFPIVLKNKYTALVDALQQADGSVLFLPYNRNTTPPEAPPLRNISETVSKMIAI